MHIAAKYGKEEISKFLIAAGVDINVKTIFGETALSSAIQAGYKAMVRFLLEAGSDISLLVGGGKTLLHIAATWRREAITRLLLEHNLDVNKVDFVQQRSALHEAAKNGHTDLVKILLEKGEDVGLSDNANKTAMSEAKESGNLRLVDLLNTWIAEQSNKKMLSLRREYYKTCLVAELRKFLHRREIEFKTKSNKSELIELLIQHDTVHPDAVYLDGYRDQSSVSSRSHDEKVIL